MHADPRTENAETPRREPPRPHAPMPSALPPWLASMLPPWLASMLQPGPRAPMPLVLPAWLVSLLHEAQERLYVSPPEPVPARAYAPARFMAIVDEVHEWRTACTVSLDVARSTAPKWMLVPDSGADAALAPWFSAARAEASRVRFLRETEELTTSRGVSERELTLIAESLLALAASAEPRRGGR
jgi:hypothetical protein